MKFTAKFLIVAFLSIILSLNLNAQNKKPCVNQQSTPKEPISQAEIQILKYMADEEKLAGDVYKTLYETWNLRIFDNISKAEDHHQKLVVKMLTKYEIEYTPKTDRGKYNDPKMEQLYLDLVLEGKKSIVDALKTGAKIEDLDIFDLNSAIENDVDSNDITAVFTNIRQGSYQHIKAFTNVLKRYDESYTPQYISEEEFNNIINE
ncbi:MAG: DUF2202 domain-containing protein [Bacteroidales bacterium]|nr:DUF2202 domain-containing protein [Bacteroidales bacterium]